MPRIARFIRENQPTVYHVISRTALQGLPIKDKDNDFLLGLIKKLSSFYFVDVLGFVSFRQACVKNLRAWGTIGDQTIRRTTDATAISPSHPARP